MEELLTTFLEAESTDEREVDPVLQAVLMPEVRLTGTENDDLIIIPKPRQFQHSEPVSLAAETTMGFPDDESTDDQHSELSYLSENEPTTKKQTGAATTETEEVDEEDEKENEDETVQQMAPPTPVNAQKKQNDSTKGSAADPVDLTSNLQVRPTRKTTKTTKLNTALPEVSSRTRRKQSTNSTKTRKDPAKKKKKKKKRSTYAPKKAKNLGPKKPTEKNATKRRPERKEDDDEAYTPPNGTTNQITSRIVLRSSDSIHKLRLLPTSEDETLLGSDDGSEIEFTEQVDTAPAKLEKSHKVPFFLNIVSKVLTQTLRVCYQKEKRFFYEILTILIASYF